MENNEKQLKLETVNLSEIEITEIGKYNGIENTQEDIDEMILNFNNQVTEPYLTIDHSHFATSQFKDALKSMSLGFVENLKRIGTKLVADFKQVPKVIGELIEAGALKKKSIEFYKKFKHANGKIYNNVLQGVTFHGANGSPAVTTLSDFINLYKNDLSEKLVNNENELCILKDSEKITEENSMNKIEIEKQEYENLLKFKNDSTKFESELEKFKVENEDLKTSKTELESKITELEKSKTEFETFKKTVEENKVNELKKEAEEYIDKQINDKKIIPASKELYVSNYIAYKNQEDQNQFETFKKDIESREVSLFKNYKANGQAEKVSIDDIDTLIIKYKNEGKTFKEARELALAEIRKSEEV